MTKQPYPVQTTETDIHLLLAKRRQIAIVWSIEDVQAVRPDLTEEQAWEVLQECEHRHDCEIGFTWLFIESVADDCFPEEARP